MELAHHRQFGQGLRTVPEIQLAFFDCSSSSIQPVSKPTSYREDRCAVHEVIVCCVSPGGADGRFDVNGIQARYALFCLVEDRVFVFQCNHPFRRRP